MRKITGILLLLLALVACQSPETNFYLLNAQPAPETASYSGGPPIVVDDVQIPGYLDRPELVRRVGDNRLEVSGADRWAAPLGDMMREVLLQNLVARLPKGAVVTSPPPGATPSPRVLRVQVDDFVARSDRQVVLDATWSVHGNQQQILRRREQISVGIQNETSAARVSAMDKALGVLADHVAASLTAEDRR